ncbi:MAG TPA: UDP-N-acetylmuramate--L-alanine ligase [bacterium]|nr:UDP-N-acetylmuramate--L-alanine ligase [bacterium]
MDYKKIHFIGMGGISMSGLAQIAMEMGSQVSGSDVNDSEMLNKLAKNGATVYIGHDKKNINDDVDLVVMTAAISDDNPEVVEARRRNLPVWRRSQYIGYLMRDQVGICVAGMHGKSTTTSLIAEILYELGEDPTVMAGAEVKAIKSNARRGKSDLLVAEACEYNRSFLDFEPTVAVLLNVEAEHLDTYRNLNDILDTFVVFANKTANQGLLVGCMDDANVRVVMNEVQKTKVGYGMEKRPSDYDGVYWRIVNLQQKNGRSTWQIEVDEENLGIDFEIGLPGKFNVLNATAALVVADFLVLDIKKVAKVLSGVRGAVRRFDVLGEKDGVIVVDDYGHHPTELQNAIRAAKDYFSGRKLWVLFWPHQYNRTEQFWDGFVESFDLVDQLIVLDVYEARKCDTDKTKVNSKILAKQIQRRGVKVQYIADYQAALQYIKKNIKKDSVLLTLGAGPVDVAAREFLNNK